MSVNVQERLSRFIFESFPKCDLTGKSSGIVEINFTYIKKSQAIFKFHTEMIYHDILLQLIMKKVGLVSKIFYGSSYHTLGNTLIYTWI